jgi:fluoride exporter
MNWLYVFLGGGLGSIARYGISQLVPYTETGQKWPWHTFIANMLSCAILGLLMSSFIKAQGLSESGRLLLITGFCGGFSTFSTLTAEVLKMYELSNYGLLASYLLVSILLGVGIMLVAITIVGK